jgi:hypothetical protein
MHAIGAFLMHFITTIFFIGLAGSAIVIAISFVEDFRELFGPDEPSTEATRAVESGPAQKRTA